MSGNKENIFEQPSSFRLVDLDGVFLTSPGDILIIREPARFAENVKFRLMRDRGFHGVNFEFSSDSSAIEFDFYKVDGQQYSSREMLEGIYQARGSMGRVDFEYIVNGTVELRSRIIFKGRRFRKKSVLYRSKTTYFNDDFFNQFDTEYDLNRTTNLNGGAITPASYTDIVLTPQVIQKKGQLEKPDGDDIFDAGTTSLRAQVNLGSVIESNFDNSFITYLSQLVGNIKDFPTLIANRFGYYFWTIAAEYEVRCTNSCTINFVVDVYDPVNDQIVESDVLDSTSYLPADIGNIKNISFATTVSDELWANRNMIFRVYLEVIEVNGARLDYINTKSIEALLTGNTKGLFLNSKFVEINEALNKMVEGLTGIANAITSAFLGIQKAALLTGKLIRGFPETEPFKMIAERAFNSLRAIYGLGYSITEETGSEKINIGQPSDFYQDVEIDYIDNAHEYEETVDAASLWSKLEIGYKNFSEGTDTALLSDSNKDFLSQHSYKTPVNAKKDTFRRISDWIASGYLIEEGKQQNFDRLPDEAWKHDDDIFIVAYNDQDTVYDQVVDIDDFMGNIVLTVHQALPHISSATSVLLEISGAPFLGPFAITGVAVDTENNRTVIFTSTPGVAIGFVLHIDLAFNITWTAPEGSESFDVFAGVDDVNATYNARLNIKNMLFANSLIINSGFTFEPGTAELILSAFKNNADLETQFAIGENYSTLDPDRVQIIQSDDLTLAIVNQNNKIYIAEIVKFKAQIGYDRILDIKKANTNELPGKNYGYLRVKDPFGVDKKWYLLEMDHNNLDNEMEFMGLRKFE